MKKSSMLLIVAALVLSSCGTAAQYASSDNGQKFQDGIYSSTPSFRSKQEKAEDQAATEALIEKTKASEIYLLGEKKDTVMIPENFFAHIQYDQKLGGTLVTVGENPYDWRYDLENNYGYYYNPYSIGASWYWSRHYDPWYWNTWSYSPWRYSSWYYNSWYDPWYYGGYYGGYWGIYDPWYYGGWGWNNWYGYYHNPYYCGWYGGWDPYWGHHHHHGHGHIGGPDHHKDVWYGSRHRTGSDRVFGGASSLRGGIGSRSTVSRSGGAVASSRAQASTGVSSGRTAGGRTVATVSSPKVSRSSVVRTTPSIRNEKTSVRNNVTASRGSVQRDAVTAGRQIPPSGRVSSATQPNYRRPAAAAPSGTVNRESSSSTPSYNRAAPAADRSSSYDRSTTRSSSSTSSYNRNSSSSSTSRSSFSSGGSSSYSRGSSGGGFSSGGSTRSGGSAGGRR